MKKRQTENRKELADKELAEAVARMPLKFKKRYAEAKLDEKLYSKMSVPYPRNIVILS